jgi:hypothetical protein
MNQDLIFQYKFKRNLNLDDLVCIRDIYNFKTLFLSKPLKFKFESFIDGNIAFIFPTEAGKMAGVHQVPFSNQCSIYQILFHGIKDLYKQEKFQELSYPIELFHKIPVELISLTVDTNNTIHVLIGKKSKSKNEKFDRISYTGNEFKKTWKKKLQLRSSLSHIFSDDEKGENGPIVYVTSNYRNDVYVVIVEANGYLKKFKKYQSNAQELGVRLTKIGKLHNGWQDFLLEDQISFALWDEYFSHKDYEAVEINEFDTESLPESPEGKEIIETFINLGYSIEYISEDIKLMKWPTEVHFINEKRQDFQRFRLCIHDDGMGMDETDKAIEIGSKIVEKYGYHRGVKSADSTDVFREEYVDDWYRYL